MFRFDDAWEWDDRQIAVKGFATDPDGVRHECLVRGEAIDEAYGTPPEGEARLRAFHDHRSEILAVLTDRLQGGHRERPAGGMVPWQVVLLASDLR